MKRLGLVIAIAIAVVGFAIGQSMGHSSDHGFFQTADLKWTDGPASLAKGAKVAMLEGNPAQEGPFPCAFNCRTVLGFSRTRTQQ